MRKVLILGSQGFIGRHLVKFYLEQSSLVVGCDLLEFSTTQFEYQKISVNSSDFESVFKKNTFEICINASGSGNVGYSLEHPLSDFEANTTAVANVLEMIRRHQADCKYLHISSAAVYGNPGRLPIHENDKKHPLSPYGWHKLMSEQVCSEYNEIFGLQTAIMRPFSVYGDGLQKQLLWDICQRLRNSDSIQLYGTGNESRDFIHCRDLVLLTKLLVEKAKFEGEVYNAASGIETKISTIAQAFENRLNGKKRISFSGEVRPGDPLNWRADVSAIQEIGFSPTIKLTEGIGDYIQWFEKTQGVAL